MRLLSTNILRLTWAAITADPSASARQIAAQLDTGYQYGDISAALRQLVAAGYIGDRPEQGAPRPIFLPFSADVEQLRQSAPPPPRPRVLPTPTRPAPPPVAREYRCAIRLTPEAHATIEAARHPGESDEAVINRVLAAALPVAADIDEFGETGR